MPPFDHLIKDNPEESIVSGLFPGKIIGFQIDPADFDEEDRFKGTTFDPQGDSYHYLSEESLAIFFADFFVDGILMGDEEETAVRDVTWARIKAGFR